MGFYIPSIRDANMADIKVSLQSWAEELGKPFGLKILTATYDDMAAVRAALDRAEVDFINASGMELAELFTPLDLRGGYASRHHGVEEGLALVVSKKSGIHGFSDLRGKRVVRLSRDRLSEIFLETQCLKATGQDCRELLVLSEEKRDIQSVYSVFFGRADAALVTLSTLHTAIDLNPQVAERLSVIIDWKARALIFVMMTKHADPASRDLILGSANEVLKTARGRQMLEMFKADEIESADAEDLRPYWTLLKEYDDLRKARAAKRK
jgi:ABC-type phosphate/phosphonate transport system substrate-binding protein